MRDFLKRSGRWLRAGWFWPLVLLALPTCALSSEGIADPNPAQPGDESLTSAVMCDIPQVPDGGVFLCATPMDIGIGMANGHGAVALNGGEMNSVVLDYSPDAQNQCGAGNPLRIDFFNEFPNGTTVCLNCGQQIPSKYADPAAVCVAKCKELVSVSGPQPPGGVDAFCQANARVSTNFDKTKCRDNICTGAGNPIPGVADPRVNPEDLTWLDFFNTTAAGNTLSFGGPVNGNFNGGAASDELITTGDAWVEFEAGEPGVSHVLGLRTSCDKIANCPDSDGTLADIGFAISLNSDNKVYVLEDGAKTIIGPIGNPYTPGERFRIHVVDHHGGTADISYWRGSESCIAGTFCNETPMYSHPIGTGPSYPLRVDATFREATASLKNVTIMRIKN